MPRPRQEAGGLGHRTGPHCHPATRRAGGHTTGPSPPPLTRPQRTPPHPLPLTRPGEGHAPRGPGAHLDVQLPENGVQLHLRDWAVGDDGHLQDLPQDLPQTGNGGR